MIGDISVIILKSSVMVLDMSLIAGLTERTKCLEPAPCVFTVVVYRPTGI